MLDALGWAHKGNGRHRLRRAFAVGLIDAGASPEEVRAALNHSDVTVTLGEYGHRWSNADEQLRDRVDERFARLES